MPPLRQTPTVCRITANCWCSPQSHAAQQNPYRFSRLQEHAPNKTAVSQLCLWIQSDKPPIVSRLNHAWLVQSTKPRRTLRAQNPYRFSRFREHAPNETRPQFSRPPGPKRPHGAKRPKLGHVGVVWVSFWTATQIENFGPTPSPSARPLDAPSGVEASCGKRLVSLLCCSRNLPSCSGRRTLSMMGFLPPICICICTNDNASHQTKPLSFLMIFMRYCCNRVSIYIFEISVYPHSLLFAK